jgi:hypothetical protein
VLKWNGAAWACASDAAGPTSAFVQGGNAFGTEATLGSTSNFAVNVVANGQRVMRWEPGAISPNLIGGNPANSVTAGVRGATIAGGGVGMGDVDPNFDNESPHFVTDHYGTIGGGYGNQAGDGPGTTIPGAFATVAGGRSNTASGFSSTVGGGFANVSSSSSSTVSGGQANIASAPHSTVAGGDGNEAGHSWATVGGGLANVASGLYATVPGGLNSLAEGNFSFAAGRRAKARGDGSFAFADSSNVDFSSTADNVFRVRATNGVFLVTDIDGAGTPQWFCSTVAGAGWTCVSDRRLKQDLVLLDGGEVLARLAHLPLYEWSPKGRNAHVRHYGPMAQDFKAAFGLGEDDTTIGVQDANGVALAAIQGLNAKLERATSVIHALSARLRVLEARLAATPE